MQPVEKKALIVGAGIGGLAAGLSLRRAGWRVTILEQAANPRELGFGLLLAPNALAALAELGVADALFQKGIKTSAVEIRRLDGRVIRRLSAPPGGPAVVALRSELHGTLLQGVGPDVLILGSEVAGFEADAQGVAVTTTAGGLHRADILIGADGVGSVIRRQLHPYEPRPRRSGYCAVRGVALGVGSAFGELSAVGYMDDGIEVGTARASTDAIYWYMSLLVRDIDAAERNPQAIVQRYRGKCDETLRTILEATKPEDMRFDELFRCDPLTTWGAGCVTLLGDAAHPVMPHTGQGAALALEDAVALGIALGGSDGRTEASLRRYEVARAARTKKFVRLGPRIAAVTTTRNRLIQMLRTLVIRMLPERVFQSL